VYRATHGVNSSKAPALYRKYALMRDCYCPVHQSRALVAVYKCNFVIGYQKEYSLRTP